MVRQASDRISPLKTQRAVRASGLTVFGNSGLWLELHESSAGLASAVQNNMPTAIFVLLEQLPLTAITSALATMLIVTFL